MMKGNCFFLELFQWKFQINKVKVFKLKILQNCKEIKTSISLIQYDIYVCTVEIIKSRPFRVDFRISQSRLPDGHLSQFRAFLVFHVYFWRQAFGHVACGYYECGEISADIPIKYILYICSACTHSHTHLRTRAQLKL